MFLTSQKKTMYDITCMMYVYLIFFLHKHKNNEIYYQNSTFSSNIQLIKLKTHM